MVAVPKMTWAATLQSHLLVVYVLFFSLTSTIRGACLPWSLPGLPRYHNYPPPHNLLHLLKKKKNTFKTLAKWDRGCAVSASRWCSQAAHVHICCCRINLLNTVGPWISHCLAVTRTTFSKLTWELLPSLRWRKCGKGKKKRSQLFAESTCQILHIYLLGINQGLTCGRQMAYQRLSQSQPHVSLMNSKFSKRHNRRE